MARSVRMGVIILKANAEKACGMALAVVKNLDTLRARDGRYENRKIL